MLWRIEARDAAEHPRELRILPLPPQRIRPRCSGSKAEQPWVV